MTYGKKGGMKKGNSQKGIEGGTRGTHEIANKDTMNKYSYEVPVKADNKYVA